MIYNRPPLNCQKCQYRFFTDQGLERHLLGSHGLVTSSMQEAANNGKDSGRCPVCGKVSLIRWVPKQSSTKQFLILRYSNGSSSIMSHAIITWLLNLPTCLTNALSAQLLLACTSCLRTTCTLLTAQLPRRIARARAQHLQLVHQAEVIRC